MPTLPWQSIIETQENRTYKVMVTYLPLRRYRDTFRFIKYVFSIIEQLKNTTGLVGYSLKAHPLKKDYWTASVWLDNESISSYVKAAPHSEIMIKMKSAMGETQFTSWDIESSRIPIDWEEAISRLQQITKTRSFK